MSRASNSLLVSDVTATPIKLKYSSSYSNTTICNSGIYAQSGLNGPVTVTGSVPRRTLRYWSARHLFYSNFLTGSYLTTTSSFDNFLQSTAASGTFEGNTTLSASTDLRYFPTASFSKIKIINIPKSSYGEKTSRKSFFLTGSSYSIADDGNGNVYDTTTNAHVGNIIYPQGFVIITNPDYYCAMDGGPFTFPQTYIFDVTQSVKSFNPITDAQADCAPVNTASVVLYPFRDFQFPSSSIATNGTITLSESDVLTNKVGIYKDYYTVSSTYCASSDKEPITVQIVDCSVRNATATALSCSINGLTLTLLPDPTPTPTATPGCTPTPTTPPATGTPTPPPPTAAPPTPTATLPPPTGTPTPTPTLPPPTATIPPPTATIPPPTPTPTLPPINTISLGYSTSSYLQACTRYDASDRVVVYSYTPSGSLTDGSVLYTTYTDPLAPPYAPNGWYSNGTKVWVIGGGGSLYDEALCLQPTPTPTPTATLPPGIGYLRYTGATYGSTAAACASSDYIPGIQMYLNNDTNPQVNDVFFASQSCDPGTEFNGGFLIYKVSRNAERYGIEIGASGTILSITTCA